MKNNVLRLSLSTSFLCVLISFYAQAQQTYEMVPLDYSYDALAPYIDVRTMDIHYNKHYAGYTNNLNKALKDMKVEHTATLEDLFRNISRYPVAVRNNAGGYYNHNLYWQNLTPDKDTRMSDLFKKAVEKRFSSLENLQKALSEASGKRFGSGWVWLIVNADHELEVTSTANQDNPLMDVAEEKGHPVLAIDVWEHAYYLNYQNRRKDYTEAVLQIINWRIVSDRYQTIISAQ